MIYFGPYVHCAVEQIEVVANIRCCTNTDCENNNVRNNEYAHRYCIKCGKVINVKSVPIAQDKISHSTAIELDEVMRPLFPELGVHLWLANMSELSYYLDTHDFVIRNVKDIDYAYITIRFTDYYKNTLEQIYKLYGSSNCTIRFGLIVWSD